MLLALDQASRTSGWAVFDDNGSLIDSGTFTCAQDDFGERLYQIALNAEQLIAKYHITEVAIEDIQLQNSVGNNVVTYKKLAEVYGVLEEKLTEWEIPYQPVFSSTWKSSLGIKGRSRPEQKKNAQLYVEQNYNKKVSQDESDAICIGSYIIKEKNSSFNWG